MDKELEARNLVSIADGKLKPGCMSSLCTSKDERMSQAKDLLERAGNIFKLQKMWNEAGECFERCARIEQELKNDPASCFEEAAHCFGFENTDKKRCDENLLKCIELYEKNGKFQSAAHIRKRMGEEYEKDNNIPMAISSYQKAASYYTMDSSSNKSNENTCAIKMADLMCISDHEEAFKESKAIYERISLSYLSSPLLKSGAKELFLKCCIVYLVYEDHLMADAYMSKFLNEDPSFHNSNEHILLKEIIDSVSENNLLNFKTAVTKFKKTMDIDKWKIHMFTKISNKLNDVNKNPIEEENYL